MKNITLNTLHSVIGGLVSRSVKTELAYDEVIDYDSGQAFIGVGEDGEYIVASYDMFEGVKINADLFSQQFLNDVAVASVYDNKTYTNRTLGLNTLPGNKLLVEATFFFD